MPTDQDQILQQIDRAVQPPGLIASASTYRLFLTTEGLYLIRLGRAMGPKVKSRDMIADAIAGAIVNKMERRLEENLRRVEDTEIGGRSPRDLLQRPKSYLIPPESVGSIRSRQTGEEMVTLWIKSSVKSIRLNCAARDAGQVAAIVAALG